jgi:hypothetical protein
MFIVSLLLGGMLLPLSAQQDVRAYGDTQKTLAEARDALLGYAMANDRLPCPASSTSNGVRGLLHRIERRVHRDHHRAIPRTLRLFVRRLFPRRDLESYAGGFKRIPD